MESDKRRKKAEVEVEEKVKVEVKVKVKAGVCDKINPHIRPGQFVCRAWFFWGANLTFMAQRKKIPVAPFPRVPTPPTASPLDPSTYFS